MNDFKALSTHKRKGLLVEREDNRMMEGRCTLEGEVVLVVVAVLTPVVRLVGQLITATGWQVQHLRHGDVVPKRKMGIGE